MKSRPSPSLKFSFINTGIAEDLVKDGFNLDGATTDFTHDRHIEITTKEGRIYFIPYHQIRFARSDIAFEKVQA